MSPDVVTRLREATGPDRGLDCALALAVGGFVIDGQRYGEPRYCRFDADGRMVCPGQNGDDLVPAYTASLDAALALVERVLPGRWLRLTRSERGWTARIGDDAIALKPTPALALCLALLTATQKEETADANSTGETT